MTYEKLKEINDSLKTIDIKGKQYTPVTERVTGFRKLYPDGSITTDIVHLDNGMCIIKATIADSVGNILSIGHAYEKEGATFINKTSYLENCVPITSEILTLEGWKYYYQLKPGDLVWGLNLDTNEMEPTEVKKINLYEKRPLIQLSTSRFKAVCTPEHKWVVRTQYKDLFKSHTKSLTSSHKIVQAVDQMAECSEMGKKLGWLMCDCEIVYSGKMPSTAYINQSKHIDEVTKLFGEGRKTKKYEERWKDNYEWIVPAEEVRKILGYFGMKDYKDLTSAMAKADIKDVMGCYHSMMLADGEGRGFSSTYLELVEAVQVMCARLGIATSFITERMMAKSTKPIYTLGIKRGDGAWFSEIQTKNIPPADVWCPTTGLGTWIMRQGTFVTLTSNCETSAVGRALGFLGIGVDESMASAEEVGNAITQQGNEQRDANDMERKIFEDYCIRLGVKPQAILKKTGWTSGKMTLEHYGRALVILKEIDESDDR